MNHVETQQSTCLFGCARGDITPPAGIYHRMWGAAAHDKAEGVHRPLQAAALLFQAADADPHSDHAQLVVTLDHCLLAAPEVGAIIDAAAGAAGIDKHAITVAFSHTHAAGLLTLDRVDQPGGDLIAPYLDEVNCRVAELAAAARLGLRPARLVYGWGRCGLAAHRDFEDRQSGQIVCGYNPRQPADDSVLVVRATDETGAMLASIVNYACHPTTLAWDNRLISPDFPGAMRETVEQATGAPCVFLQGASGDLGPKEGFVGDVGVADRNGRQLGYAALAALEALPPPDTQYRYQGPVTSGATIGVWSYEPAPSERIEQTRRWRADRRNVELAYRPELPTSEQTKADLNQWLADENDARAAGHADKAGECRAMAERKRRLLARLDVLPAGKYPLDVAAWRMGDAVWLAVQGEPYNLLQRALRERFAGRPLVVASIANGWGPSYLPPMDLYGKGVYQESVAVLAPGCLEQLIDEIGERIEALLNS